MKQHRVRSQVRRAAQSKQVQNRSTGVEPQKDRGERVQTPAQLEESAEDIRRRLAEDAFNLENAANECAALFYFNHCELERARMFMDKGIIGVTASAEAQIGFLAMSTRVERQLAEITKNVRSIAHELKAHGGAR